MATINEQDLLARINEVIDDYQDDKSTIYRNGAVDALRYLAAEWFAEEDIH